MLIIRLARYGKKKMPFYKIVVINKKKARNGEFIEKIGTFNPIKNIINIDMEKINYWKKVGAQLSNTVFNIINKKKKNENKI